MSTDCGSMQRGHVETASVVDFGGMCGEDVLDKTAETAKGCIIKRGRLRLSEVDIDGHGIYPIVVDII
jgi:hypothetical protein